jgi:hypothetical protein
MNAPIRFRVNAPMVISETIDSEAILINLDTGAYYSLRETGAALWQLIEQGAAGQQLIDELASRYDGPSTVIASSIQSLLAELAQEQLIVPLGDDSAAPQFVGTASTVGHGKQPFTSPVLEKFTDMADLLLLDPIHDVSEQGWPTPRQAR